MRRYPLIYSPLVFAFIIAFLLIGAFLFALLQIGVIGYAFDKIGVPPRYMFSILFLSIFGSLINIPVARLPQETVHRQQIINLYGLRYVVPEPPRPRETIIAVNVGGALVPTVVSVYLLTVIEQPFTAAAAVAVLSLVIHRLARPVPGLGIAVPTLVPPVLAAVAALIFAPANSAAVAYIAGTMGTLIGADLMNLGKIRELGAPVASIGGAGTFDGIFITGILAVILASI